MTDIGHLAGVSRTTVDRVLKGKGEVSESARSRILKVLAENDYSPNKYASALSKNEEFRIAVLFPQTPNSFYINKVADGIKFGFEDLTYSNKTLDFFWFEPSSEKSLEKTINYIIDFSPKCVIIGPFMTKKDIIHITTIFAEREIYYSLVDSFFEDLNYVSFHGHNGYASGTFLSSILCKINYAKNVILVKFAGKVNTIQQKQRECGFIDYICSHTHKNPTTIEVDAESLNDSSQLDIKHIPSNTTIVTLNSSISSIRDLFSDKVCRERKLHFCGYDESSKNLEYLRCGKIELLICQHPFRQGIDVLNCLFNYCILKNQKKITSFYPVDLLIKENASYYIS